MSTFFSERRRVSVFHHSVVVGLTAALFWTGGSASAFSPHVPAAPNRTGGDLVKEAEYVTLSLASARLQRGQNAQALPYLLETVEKNPINVLALFQLGNVYLDLAKASDLPAQQAVFLMQSEQAFERVLTLSPELTLTHFKLGKIALMRNDIAAAKLIYRQGLAIEPDNSALIFNLARVCDQNNEKAEAIRLYRETIAAEPGFVYAYNNLGLLYEEAGDLENAEAYYKQALKRDKRYNLARLNLGNLYASTGKYTEAKAQFDEALALEPENEWVHYYLGNLHLRMGRYDEAINAYNKVLKLNPGHATTYYLLAVSLSKMKRMDEALQAGLHYVQLQPEGEFAKEMKSLIMTVKLSQSNGLYHITSPSAVLPNPAKR